MSCNLCTTATSGLLRDHQLPGSTFVRAPSALFQSQCSWHTLQLQASIQAGLHCKAGS